jgi:arylsulfatase A-like enzyme
VEPNLFLLLLDTARADAFSPWGGPVLTPALGALAQRGTAYRQAIAPAPWTLASTASIFSGLLPTEHGISGDSFSWSAGRPTSPAAAVDRLGGGWLSNALRARGYATWAASCNAWISPWGGFDRGFDRFVFLHDRVRLPRGRLGRLVRAAKRSAGLLDRGGSQCLQEFRSVISESPQRPLFGFVDLMETHSPYDPPRRFYPFAPWRRSRTRRLSTGTARFVAYNVGAEAPPSEYVPTIRALYRGAARYTDWLMGGFVEAIRSSGRPTVLVVLADHGENLGEHGLFHHNSSLHETVLHVPLVLWGHGLDLEGGWKEEPIGLTGLFRWMLRTAEGHVAPLEPGGMVVSEYESTVRHNGIPSEVAGRMDELDQAVIPPLFHHPGVAIRRGSLKYQSVEGRSASLFDLASDPAEEHDLLPGRPELSRGFDHAVEEWRRRRAALPVAESGELAEDEITDHLRMLGYVE